jgi:8-oxo-dGTP pyrophosphatase MutT (NUDIX family)
MERFAIPGAGAIIRRSMDGCEQILLQERCKKDAPLENGLLEIPAGKIREFESIFDTIRREVKEETGLDIVKIEGEEESSFHAANGYKVLNFKPFSCSQNLEGAYPIMVFIFVCTAEGELLNRSDEAKNFIWIGKDELSHILVETPERVYPMHVDTLRAYLKS